MKINFNLFKKISLVSFLSFLTLLMLVFLVYFAFLPFLVKSSFVNNAIKEIAKKEFQINLTINNPKLITSLKPEIEFKIDNLEISKKNKTIAEIKDFEVEFSFEKIFKKQFKLNKLNSKEIFIDVNEIISMLPKQNFDNNKKTSDCKIDFVDSEIKIDSLILSYLQNSVNVNALLNNIILKDKKLVFASTTDIKKDKIQLINIKTADENKINIDDNKINAENLRVYINDSNLKLNISFENEKLCLHINSNKFYLKDIFKLVNSNLIIPNGEALLLPLKNPDGNISFNIKMDNNDLSGIINVNNTGVAIKDVSDIPIKIQDGNIEILKDKILFKDLIGFYGKSKTNKIKIKGDIKDYYKTFDSNIEIESIITNEFFKDYLSKLINNTTLFVSKPSRTKIIYKSKNNIMDIIWFAQIDKGVDFGVSSEKSALSDYDRALLAEININNNKLNIKNINYYIASNIVRGVKLQPILQANALMDFTGKIDKAGFAFGRELPCEFLNVFIGQQLFKKGTIKGDMNVVFKNNIPYLDTNLEIKKTLIPSQRIAIKEAVLKTDNNYVNIIAQGRFKKANYKVNGKIKNGFVAPYIIKDFDLDIDNLDVERILNSFNSNNSQTVQIDADKIATEDDLLDDNFMFDTNLIRIEDCDFKLANGNYKELKFGNIKAKLTLDDKGILNIYSNKFDIAQGISSLKVICDLKKLKYYIKLGVKDIDSNLMTKTLFNLDKEITGKATGLIELNGDETLKMNGGIKFVVKDGTIGKVGLVEYLLKIATVFRNPIVMVSPTTIMDIISIPEGKFDKIVGSINIKDNVLAPIDIKSYSSSLSALIKGKFDLERHDASLRIYTRFSTNKKSVLGLLRNLSLNSLANKVKLNSKNDANYYESELSQLPQIDIEENKTQVFLTQVEGDIEHFNFLSSLKRVK